MLRSTEHGDQRDHHIQRRRLRRRPLRDLPRALRSVHGSGPARRAARLRNPLRLEAISHRSTGEA